MPTSHPLVTAFPTGSNPAIGTIRTQLGAAFALVVLSAAAAADLDLTGITVQELRLNGRAFLYDAADTTTAHDGITCLVTSDGKRFKIEDVALVTNVVLSNSTDAQPGSPTVGDQYRLTAAPSGSDWASHAEEVGVYTARGWEFIAPFVGMTLYVVDLDGFEHYTDAPAWAAGLGSTSIAAGSIGLTQLAHPFGVNAEAQQNAPPGGTPAVLTTYIVGTSPSGAFSGHANDIAVADGAGGWTFYDPAEGDRVYNKAIALEVFWKSGSWQADSTSYALQAAAKSFSGTISTSGTPAILLSAAFQAQRANSVIRFTLFNYTNKSTTISVTALYIDSDATAHRSFDLNAANTPLHRGQAVEYHPGDTSAHTYHIKVTRSAGVGNEAFNVKLLIEELGVTVL